MCRKDIVIGGLVVATISVFCWGILGNGRETPARNSNAKWEYKVVTVREAFEKGSGATPSNSKTGDDFLAFAQAIGPGSYQLVAKMLTKYGDEGWELVAVTNDGLCYLKRPSGP